MTPIPLSDTSRPPPKKCPIWAFHFINGWGYFSYSLFEPTDLADAGFTHWHPDQSDAPTEQPDTPRTDAAIQHSPFECSISIDFARTLERELAEAHKECAEQARLNGMGAEREAGLHGRIAELERELAALRNSHANIYLALGGNEADHTKWPEQIAALRADRERLDWLQRFLQLGGSSVFTTCTGQAQEPRDDDTDDTRWNHPFCIGHNVEVEHRGCYRWEELSNGSRSIRAAIDAARSATSAQQEDGV